MPPASLQHIALMTQWTEFDAGAERMAIELARRLKLRLTVVVPLFSNPELEVVAHDLVADAEAAAARAATEFRARAETAGVRAEIRVRRGDELWRVVVDEAHAEQVDLIVTRRRGHRGFLGKLRVGDMVRHVAAYASCPVMMVPRGANAPSHGILAAIDSEANLEPVTESAAALASGLEITLDVLLVPGHAPDADAWRRLAQSTAQRVGLQVDVTVGQRPLVDAIEARLSAAPADLLVLGIDPAAAHHGKLGEAVEAVVGRSVCATLLIRTQARPS